MTPILTVLQEQLLQSELVTAEQLTVYFHRTKPNYTPDFDPNQQLPADRPITLGMKHPVSVVINPYSGDLVDLLLVLNLILDDLQPASRQDPERLTVSAEVLDGQESILVVEFELNEKLTYIPDPDGHIEINNVRFKRDDSQQKKLNRLTQVVHVPTGD